MCEKPDLKLYVDVTSNYDEGDIDGETEASAWTKPGYVGDFRASRSRHLEVGERLVNLIFDLYNIDITHRSNQSTFSQSRSN